MTIYLDVVFIENLGMNMAIILTEAVCIGGMKAFFRKFLGAILASLFYIITLVEPIASYFQVLVAFLVVRISFGRSRFWGLIKRVCLFYFISFLFGGVSFGLMSVLNHGKFSVFNGVIVGDFKWSWLVGSAVLGAIMVVIVIKKKARHVLVDVIISVHGKLAQFRILLDTGNLLREPYGNRPVMIIEKSTAQDFLEKEVFDSIHDFLVGKRELPVGMFFIPYRSIGNNSGYLIGIKPDYVLLRDSGKKYSDIVIGICEDVICENGAYSGIFGLDTFDGGVCYEYG